MYDDLVKRLRDYSAARKGEIAELTAAAAEAIEELGKQVELEHQSGFADGQIAANRKRHRWIPVMERLPEDYKPVLLYNGEDIATGYMHSDKRFTVNGSHFPSRPTHWMPLPEPPQEE